MRKKREHPGPNKYKNTRFDKYLKHIPGGERLKDKRIYPYLEAQAISLSKPMPYAHQLNLCKSFDFT